MDHKKGNSENRKGYCSCISQKLMVKHNYYCKNDLFN